MVFAKYDMEKPAEDGAVVISQPAAETPTKSKMGKYVVVGVSVVSVSLLVIGGFLGAMYLLRDTANIALKTRAVDYHDDQGNRVDETYQEYPHDVIQYTVKKGEDSFTVIEDMGRRLRVLNTTYNGKRACLLTPLNDKQNPAASDNDDVPEEGTTYDYVNVDEHQIVDKDILGRHSQNVCADVPLYWALHKEGTHDNGTRQKRQIHCDRCDCYGCVKQTRAAATLSSAFRKRRDVYHCDYCICSGCS